MNNFFRPAPPVTKSDEVNAIITALDDQVRAISPIGSRVTCSPPPADTDEDWLILLPPLADEDIAEPAPFDKLKELGFTQDGSPEFYTGNDAGGFRSWRRGDLNLVTTRDAFFYERFMTATHLAQRFNLLDKADRIALFQAMLYGVDPRYLEERKRPVSARPALSAL